MRHRVYVAAQRVQNCFAVELQVDPRLFESRTCISIKKTLVIFLILFDQPYWLFSFPQTYVFLLNEIGTLAVKFFLYDVNIDNSYFPNTFTTLYNKNAKKNLSGSNIFLFAFY